MMVAFAFLTASAVAQPKTTKLVAAFGGHTTEVLALAWSAGGFRRWIRKNADGTFNRVNYVA